MPKKNLPSYRLHKPTGQAIVSLRGQMFYLGKYKSKSSREKYNELITDYLTNDCKLPPTRSRKEITVEELAILFLEWASGYYLDEDGNQTMTLDQCRYVLSPLVEFYGRIAVSEFGPLSLKFVREKLVDKGLVRSTINSKINIIRQAFRWGVENELVTPDVSHALDAVRKLQEGRTVAKDNDDVQPVPDEIVDATLPHLPVVVHDMVQLQRFIGGRPQDVCNMRAGDIERTGDVWTYRPYRHKTKYKGKKRSLAIGPKGQSLLLPYLDRKTDDEFIFSPEDSIKQFRATQRVNRKTKVQPSQVDRSKSEPKRKPRKKYDTHSYRQAIHRACDKAGVERWNPNQLRHSVGTTTVENFSLEAAKEFLGHASVKTTEKYYVAPLPELAAKVARKIG